MKGRGDNLKFYLSVEDQAILKMAMEEDRFTNRGPYLVYLLKQRGAIQAFRMERAKEVKKVISDFHLSPEELEKV